MFTWIFERGLCQELFSTPLHINRVPMMVNYTLHYKQLFLM